MKIQYLNTYTVKFESGDGRIWDVNLKAHGYEQRGRFMHFWRWSGFFLSKETLHIVKKDAILGISLVM
jgi:hypothetical protein